MGNIASLIFPPKPKGGCMNPGKVTRNPFLNYLREMRKKICTKSVVQIAIRGAEEWRKMTDVQKLPYRKMAKEAEKPANKPRVKKKMVKKKPKACSARKRTKRRKAKPKPRRRRPSAKKPKPCKRTNKLTGKSCSDGPKSRSPSKKDCKAK